MHREQLCSVRSSCDLGVDGFLIIPNQPLCAEVELHGGPILNPVYPEIWDFRTLWVAQNSSTEKMLQLCFENLNKGGCAKQITGASPAPGGAG